MSRDERQLEAYSRFRNDPFAGLSRRLCAWIIDVIAITALIFVGVSVLDEIFGPAVQFKPEAATLDDVVAPDIAVVALHALFATGLSAAYFVIPWSVLGGSPAQLALGMRVGDDAGGARLTVQRATARWILLLPPFATVSALTASIPRLGWVIWGSAVVWYLVLLLTTAVSETKQGMHDRLVRSVVRRRRAAAVSGASDAR